MNSDVLNTETKYNRYICSTYSFFKLNCQVCLVHKNLISIPLILHSALYQINYFEDFLLMSAYQLKNIMNNFSVDD